MFQGIYYFMYQGRLIAHSRAQATDNWVGAQMLVKQFMLV